MTSITQLNRALAKVQTQLEKLNFYTEAIAAVDVYLIPVSTAYGYKWDGKRGFICIPRISLSKLKEKFFSGYPYASLADVVRHEYGHAVADVFSKQVKTKEYKAAFKSTYSSKVSYDYDPELFVSEYAATSSAEDFCETFMYYVKHMGKIPERFKTPAIKEKWSFIKKLSATI
ncbi:MAG: putative zinc-binding metallopeptidase [Fibrobacteres bacterium]|nr:putative zinc-binding metallopeptidase [Fibrobacterota bacterium]